MAEDELELRILRRFIAQHKAAAVAGAEQDEKCARELDMRNVLRELTGMEGAELKYEADRWYDRLVKRPAPHEKATPLRPCSRGEHRYYARAYTAGNIAPAWDRIQELERALGETSLGREVEQKFGILGSSGQARRDFDAWTSGGRSPDIPVAVLFLDIDDFKALNSKFTETKVDGALFPSFQGLLERLIRHRGYAYREGGEEFVLLLANHTIEEARVFAESLRETIAREAYKVDEETVTHLTVSIGIARFPEHGQTYDGLKQAANVAKRLAKERGKNCVVIA